MNFSSVPIIVICCYILGEIIKIIFKKRKTVYRAIPIILSVSGGILGIVIFISNPELLYDSANIWNALEIGIVSGACATGANQIIKQVFYKNDERKADSENDIDS